MPSTSPPASRRQRRRPMSEINVVPYIDVMLVLLVIFMITAPLMAQGVKVDLPQATAEALDRNQKEPLVVSVAADGRYYLNMGSKQDEPVDAETLQTQVAAVLRHQPDTAVMVRGDRSVNYGEVVGAMVLLQQAGASNLGLVTQSPEPASKRR